MLPVLLMAFSTSSIGEVITLSGTSGSPNSNLDVQVDPGVSYAEWNFRSDGTVDQVSSAAGTVQFQDGTEWTNKQDSPAVTWYVRFTLFSGDTPVVNGGGASMGDILVMTSDNRFRFTQSGAGAKDGIIKVEIGDATMASIEATGYYRARAEVSL